MLLIPDAMPVDSQAMKIQHAFDTLVAKVPSELCSPGTAIICGSGLGGLADSVLPGFRYEIDYAQVPGFPKSTVAGHAAKLVFGLFKEAGEAVVLMVGRFHFYEGHSIQEVTFPIRLFKLLGVKTLIVTNAAGGLNPDYTVGDVVVMSDHLNLAGLSGVNPLRGPNLDDYGVRFPPLSDAYDLALKRLAHVRWKEILSAATSRRLHEGVYAFVGGPSYETRAECRMLHKLGADVVGMSTVPEVIVARHCGMRVLAMSLVTNNAVLQPAARGDDIGITGQSSEELVRSIEEGKASHEEVLQAGREAASDMQVGAHRLPRLYHRLTILKDAYCFNSECIASSS